MKNHLIYYENLQEYQSDSSQKDLPNVNYIKNTKISYIPILEIKYTASERLEQIDNNIAQFPIKKHIFDNNEGTIYFNKQISEIPSNLFQNCSTLTSVTIPKCITSIKASAFNGCTALNKIVFESEVPPIVEGDPFVGVNKNMCAIYVPAKTVKAYRESNELWNEFIFAVPVSATKKFVSFCSDVPFTTRQFNGTRWVAQSLIWMYWVDKRKNNDPTDIVLTPTRDYETKIIPAGFGLVMKTTSTGGSGYIFMPPVGTPEKTDLISDNNMLKGVLTDTYIEDLIANDSDNNYYIVVGENDHSHTKKVTSGLVKAGEAYLIVPKNLEQTT